MRILCFFGLHNWRHYPERFYEGDFVACTRCYKRKNKIHMTKKQANRILNKSITDLMEEVNKKEV